MNDLSKYAILYHGGTDEIKMPAVLHGRIDVDFGPGFYTTADLKMARKWACTKSASYLNTYSFNPDGLNILHLSADRKWLDYVVANRTGNKDLFPFDDNYDVIIGPTADDRIFVIADLYLDGLIGADDAIEIINCMNYSEQIVFKHQEAVNKNLVFNSSKQIYGQEKSHLLRLFREDTKKASEKTKELLRKKHGR